jgi:DNA-binding YbaB/EbfC family protein
MDFSKMMKQAQQLQKDMAEAQKRIESMEVEGISGGGMVTLTLQGNGKMKNISINNSLFEEKEPEIVEDLVVAAYNEAWEKMEKKRSEEMGGLMGGASLPFNLLG